MNIDMETLAALLLFVAIAAYLGGFVWVIVVAAKNTSALKPVLTVFAGFILFIFAAIISPFDSVKDEATSTSSETQAAPSTPAPLPTATLIPTSTPMPTATPAPIRVDISDLLDEYEQNKVRANARLRYRKNGKIPVSTSGYVSKVEELYVTITPEQSSHQELLCYYADTRSAFHITKDQLISVTGKVSGEGESSGSITMFGAGKVSGEGEFSGNITMFGCEIEGIDLEKKPLVSAQALRSNIVQVFCIPQLSFVLGGYMGTGVIIDAEEGIILTVHHVISDENDCETVEVEIQGIEQRIPAEVVKHCASIDRGRIRVSPETLSGLSIQPIYRAAAPAQIDQEIYFWGYGPGSLRMETGVVTDDSFRDAETLVDAYAVPGDSGSPVFNEYGHLLGTMSRSNRSDISVYTGDECE